MHVTRHFSLALRDRGYEVMLWPNYRLEHPLDVAIKWRCRATLAEITLRLALIGLPVESVVLEHGGQREYGVLFKLNLLLPCRLGRCEQEAMAELAVQVVRNECSLGLAMVIVDELLEGGVAPWSYKPEFEFFDGKL